MRFGFCKDCYGGIGGGASGPLVRQGREDHHGGARVPTSPDAFGEGEGSGLGFGKTSAESQHDAKDPRSIPTRTGEEKKPSTAVNAEGATGTVLSGSSDDGGDQPSKPSASDAKPSTSGEPNGPEQEAKEERF